MYQKKDMNRKKLENSLLISNTIKAGIKYYTHIVNAKTFSDMSAKELNIKKIANSVLEITTFKNIEEAK